METNWAIKHLEKNESASVLFKECFKHFTNTKTGEKILECLSTRVSFAFPSTVEISLKDVEHPESVDDPGTKDLSVLTFRMHVNKNQTGSLFVAAPENKKSFTEYDYWKDVGHIEIFGVCLYGSFNSSLWENDEYSDLVFDLHTCVIEISDDKWIVTDEDYKQFYYIDEKLVPTLLSVSSVSEIYLRLLYAEVFEQTISDVLKKDFDFSKFENDKTPFDSLYCDLGNCDLDQDKTGLWAKYLDSNITSLDLSMNDLIELPDEIKELKNLEELNLYANEFTSIPDWICEFSKLKKLKLTSNDISQLPENLGNLTELVELCW